MESCLDIITSQMRSLRPTFLTKRPHFNFISVHYFYIIGLIILGSVLIYGPGRGDLSYIDSLFFAAGAATQAGLNTVDLNRLTTYQQAAIYVIAGIANPITINSFVVVLRLYWFEKRFQNIAREARLRRGTISKSKVNATGDPSRLESGVGGRHITVMHNGTKSRLANDGTYLGPVTAAAADGPPPGDSGDSSVVAGRRRNSNNSDGMIPPRFTLSEPLEARRPEIKFAAMVKRSDGLDDGVTKMPPTPPEGLSEGEPVFQLQRQPTSQDDEVLRIPGPLDAERGAVPRRIVSGQSDEDDDGTSSMRPRHRQWSATSADSVQMERSPRASVPQAEAQSVGQIIHRDFGNAGNDDGNDDDNNNDGDTIIDGTVDVEADGRQRLGQTITIQEPEKPSQIEELNEDARAFVHVFSIFRPRWGHRSNHRGRSHSSSNDAGESNHNNLNHIPSGRPTRRQNTFQKIRTAFSRDKEQDPAPYLSYQPTLGRNSTFLGLSEEQREELGGIEYRSLKTLALVLLVYYWGFWLLGVVCFIPWIERTNTFGVIVDAADQSRVWWGFFTSHSAFMDLGFTLTPDSMNSFNKAVFPLLLMSFLIVIGNTGFPVMLRFVIWVTSNLVPRGSGLYEELRFLLDHPRRCFTLLFQSGATWWLFWLLVILNGLDLLFFCVLDLGSGPISEIPAGIRVLDGLFQAFSTRTAGFSCVNLAELHPAVQASYMIMMYISVFPIAISVRRTNVYEEKSLGVYNQNDVDEQTSGNDLEFVGAHLRRQLSFDLWFLSLGFFILTISEGSSLQSVDFTMFSVLFEVISAYGTVGMSLGYSGGNASLSSQFSVVGKLVIIAMMIRGRHRGLPYGLDRAILLPSESLNAREAAAAEAELAREIQRRNSAVSLTTQATANGRTSTNRGRRRSRSMERVNSHIISQFLHPGPPVPVHHNHFTPSAPRRSYTEGVLDNRGAQATGVDFADQNWRTQQ